MKGLCPTKKWIIWQVKWSVRGVEEILQKNVNVRQALEELQELIILWKPTWQNCALSLWLRPSDDKCCGYGQYLAYPLVHQDVEHINWLFPLPKKQLGRCVRKALKYYCEKTKLHSHNKCKQSLSSEWIYRCVCNWIERGQLLAMSF